MQIFDPPPEPARRLPRLSLPRPGLPRLRVPMPAFLRRPLTWVIAAEAAITLSFVLAAWHLLTASLPAAPAGAPLGLLPSPAASDTRPDVSRLISDGGGASAAAPHPGLGQSSGFLGGLLGGLNQDQAAFEHQEWSALQALSGAIRTYIETVMLPAVERAAHSSASSRSP